MVKNFMEIVVDQVLGDLLNKPEECLFSCSCERCIDSIKAISLNHLKPFYITTRQGEVFGTYCTKEVQNNVNVLSEILRAKQIVEANPNHNNL